MSKQNLCVCGQRKPVESLSCGGCPRRRASDSEAEDLESSGNALRCTAAKCGRIIVPSVKPGHETTQEGAEHVKCLECYKEQGPYDRAKLESCSFSKHYPPDRRLVASEGCDWYAIESARSIRDTKRKRVCFQCAEKHKLTPWREWAIDHGTHNPETGEVLPRTLETGNLTLSSDPWEKCPGGAARVWMPVKGIEGTRRVVNGCAEPVELLFVPRRFQHVSLKGKTVRCIVADYTSDSSIKGLEGARPGTIAHGGINAWLDSLTDIAGLRPDERTLSSVGLCYVRLDGVHSATERHRLVVSNLRAYRWSVEADTGAKVSVREWLEHAQTRRDALP